MKNLLTVLVLIATAQFCFGQDLIETKGGHTYEVKVVELTGSYVEFYFLHDEDKEIKKIGRENVAKIILDAWNNPAAQTSTPPKPGQTKVKEKSNGVTNTSTPKETSKKADNKPESKKVEPKKEEGSKPNKSDEPTIKANKPIEVKEENKINCAYDLNGGDRQLTKPLPFRSTNEQARPYNLIKKFDLYSVRGDKEGGKIYLVFDMKADLNFAMNKGNKVMMRLSNGSVVQLENSTYATAEHKTKV